MRKWVALLIVFNVIDAISTFYIVSHANGQEFNPIVDYIYRFSPLLWLIIKFALVLIGSISVLGKTNDTHTRFAFIAVTIFYGTLSIYQLAILTLLLAVF